MRFAYVLVVMGLASLQAMATPIGIASQTATMAATSTAESSEGFLSFQKSPTTLERRCVTTVDPDRMFHQFPTSTHRHSKPTIDPDRMFHQFASSTHQHCKATKTVFASPSTVHTADVQSLSINEPVVNGTMNVVREASEEASQDGDQDENEDGNKDKNKNGDENGDGTPDVPKRSFLPLIIPNGTYTLNGTWARIENSKNTAA
ncbi:hypothetical protein EG329_000131 [Mollisiaceae sp. DMI_Dod_QoI]|nr:hypothetical protein EG329_000131 [Helotiales sp. DMI_Dod_QoI]